MPCISYGEPLPIPVATSWLEEEIGKDFDAAYILPERIETDIDCKMMCDRYGITETAARRRMETISKRGTYELITVSDTTSTTGYRKVLRKK